MCVCFSISPLPAFSCCLCFPLSPSPPFLLSSSLLPRFPGPLLLPHSCFLPSISTAGLGHQPVCYEDTGQYVPVSHSIQPPLYSMSLLKTRFLSPDDDNSHDPMLLQLSELSEPVSIAES